MGYREDALLSSSSSPEQYILRLIMGDVEDPYLGLTKLLQGGGTGSGSAQDMEFNAGFGVVDMEFNAGFGVVDQGFGFEPVNDNTTNLAVNGIDSCSSSSVHANSSEFPFLGHNGRIGPGSVSNQNPNPAISASAGHFFPGMFQNQPPFPPPVEVTEEKLQTFNPQILINQNQAHFGQNPAMFLPLSYTQLQEHHPLSPPSTKRLNSGPIGANIQIERPEFLVQRQQTVPNELAVQQTILNPICQVADLIETGNQVLAQRILARLNHQLSISIGKPYIRAAFYFKEALQLLLQLNNSRNSTSLTPCSLILKIGAYKAFSEISPILQFANFTCNQALLEACDGFNRVHIVDFDIGFGGQWASFMQELALRNGGVPELKITAFVSPSSHDEIELAFTQESLRNFASDINIPFELEILGFESLNSIPFCGSEKEVIAVYLPIAPFSNCPSALPMALRFVKQLSPKIVVSLDRDCDRTDLPFADHVNHSIMYYSILLESLEAVNMNPEALLKIERFFIQLGIEKFVSSHFHHPNRTPHPWKSLLLQSGFSPFQFSNFAESQAECLVRRTPVRGFHVEKRQSSLVLCWQGKELVSASAWRS